MTFSRRAASEMTKRVERIARKVLGDNAGIMTDALTWAGTYHGIGARLLREYAEQIGLDPAFTIHDREEFPDLMNLVRHEKGFLEDGKPLPDQRDVPLDLFALRQRRDADRAGHRRIVSMVLGMGDGAQGAVRSLRRSKAEAERARLRRPAALLGANGRRFRPGRRHRRPLRPCPGRRVPGHEPPAILDPAGAQARRPGPDGGRRRRAIDLLVPRRHRAQHPRFPDQFSPPANIITLDRNYRSTQTILAAANGVIGLAKERFTKNLWTERAAAAKPQLVSVRDEADQARFIVERILENRESGTLLKEQAVLFRTSSHSGPLEIELTRRNIPFVKFGGLKFLDAAHIKDMLALLRFVENPRDRVAGFRLLHLLPGIGSATAQRVLDHMAEAADPIAALASLPTPPRAGDDWKRFVEAWAISDIRNGPWIWSGRGFGTNRISIASMRMPKRGGRI